MRSTSAAAAITSPPASSTASIASRERKAGGDHVLDQQDLLTRAAAVKPRRSSKVPVGRSTKIASTPSARPISWPMMTPPIAGETTISIRARRSRGSVPASAAARRRGARRIHQHARALQVVRAVQARGEDEMALEQRARWRGIRPGLPLRSSHVPGSMRRRRPDRGSGRSCIKLPNGAADALEGTGSSLPIRRRRRAVPGARIHAASDGGLQGFR